MTCRVVIQIRLPIQVKVAEATNEVDEKLWVTTSTLF